MTELERLYADINTAARFLMDSDFTIDTDEAIRIGMRLTELVGMMKAYEGTNPVRPR